MALTTLDGVEYYPSEIRTGFEIITTETQHLLIIHLLPVAWTVAALRYRIKGRTDGTGLGAASLLCVKEIQIILNRL